MVPVAAPARLAEALPPIAALSDGESAFDAEDADPVEVVRVVVGRAGGRGVPRNSRARSGDSDTDSRVGVGVRVGSGFLGAGVGAGVLGGEVGSGALGAGVGSGLFVGVGSGRLGVGVAVGFGFSVSFGMIISSFCGTGVGAGFSSGFGGISGVGSGIFGAGVGCGWGLGVRAGGGGGAASEGPPARRATVTGLPSPSLVSDMGSAQLVSRISAAKTATWAITDNVSAGNVLPRGSLNSTSP